jgi:hypothetical protein
MRYSALKTARVSPPMDIMFLSIRARPEFRSMTGWPCESRAGVDETAIGLTDRISNPRTVVSPPMKNLSKNGTVELLKAWMYSPRNRNPIVFRPRLIHLSDRK